MAQYRMLGAGDPAPLFRQRCTSNEDYNFDTVAGRYIVLCFFATAGDAHGRRMLKVLEDHRELFDDRHIALFGVSMDPRDEQQQRVRESLPGIRHFWDFNHQIGRLYGASPLEPQKGPVRFRRQWMVLDPDMRIRAVFPSIADAGEVPALMDCLMNLPPVGLHGGVRVHAPVIILPRVFEPEFCTELIGLYDAHGGEDSGFMRDVDGKTTLIKDYHHKRRSDYLIEDEALKSRLQQKVTRRVVPEIRKIHQFEVTRMERYIVARYDSATRDHFNAHRDNTTKGTAHRRFAMSVLLNDDYEGGELSFPEYGNQPIRGPAGTAIIFSFSLLHAVSPVSRGQRYVFLPFLYDDAAAAIREANNAYLDEKVGQYRR